MKTRIVISSLFLFSLLGLYGCEQQAPESPTMGEQPEERAQPPAQEPGQQPGQEPRQQPGQQPGQQ